MSCYKNIVSTRTSITSWNTNNFKQKSFYNHVKLTNLTWIQCQYYVIILHYKRKRFLYSKEWFLNHFPRKLENMSAVKIIFCNERNSIKIVVILKYEIFWFFFIRYIAITIPMLLNVFHHFTNVLMIIWYKNEISNKLNLTLFSFLYFVWRNFSTGICKMNESIYNVYWQNKIIWNKKID